VDVVKRPRVNLGLVNPLLFLLKKRLIKPMHQVVLHVHITLPKPSVELLGVKLLQVI